MVYSSAHSPTSARSVTVPGLKLIRPAAAQQQRHPSLRGGLHSRSFSQHAHTYTHVSPPKHPSSSHVDHMHNTWSVPSPSPSPRVSVAGSATPAAATHAYSTSAHPQRFSRYQQLQVFDNALGHESPLQQLHKQTQSQPQLNLVTPGQSQPEAPSSDTASQKIARSQSTHAQGVTAPRRPVNAAKIRVRTEPSFLHDPLHSSNPIVDVSSPRVVPDSSLVSMIDLYSPKVGVGY